MQLSRHAAAMLWCAVLMTPAYAASIKDAFELASQLDADVQAAQRSKQDSAIRNAQSLTPEPLSLTISGTQSLNDNLSPTQGAREFEAELGIPLWQWGQKDRRLAELQQSALVEQSQLSLSRWALAGELREAVWAARLAELEQERAAQKLKAIEKISADLARQLKAGEVAPLDVNLAQQALIEAQLELERSQTAFAHSQQQFQALAAGAVLPNEAESIASQYDVVHPQQQALLAQAEWVQAQLAQARYDTRDTPELSLSVTRERGAPDEEYKNLGKISVRIPFGSEGRTQARISSSNAELITTQVQAKRVAQQLSAQQSSANQARALAARQVQMAEQSRALAQQAWDWQQRSFRAGQTGLAAYLNAQRDWLDRGFAVRRAELELGLANSRYLQTLGVLP